MPDWVRLVGERLRLPGAPFARRQRIVEELAGVLEEAYLEARSEGLSEAEAQQRAEEHAGDWERLSKELGRVEGGVRIGRLGRAVEERPARARGWRLLADLGQDLRHGLRSLRRRPLLVGTATVVLALGIGANTAIFSLVEAVLLRPLPYPEPERLAIVWERLPGGQRNVVSAANFLDWREQSQSFSAMCALVYSQPSLSGGDDPERVLGARVTAGFFELLGIPAALGRTLQPHDEVAGAEKVVVLSDPLWQRRFGADPEIVGKEIRIDGELVTVVGVMPPRFRLRSNRRELWTPLALDPAAVTRDLNYLRVVADVKVWGLDDESPGQIYLPYTQSPWPHSALAVHAATDENALVRPVQEAILTIDDELPLTRLATMEAIVSRSTAQPRFQTLLMGVFAAVALLLAALGVYGVVAYSVSQRTREIGIRLAVGARPSEVLGVVMRETLSITLRGMVLGLLAALGLARLMASVLFGVAPMDPLTFGLVAGVLGVAAVLAGFLPAHRASRIDPVITLRHEH